MTAPPVPIHDWTRVGGFWSSFHLNWIAELYQQLNDGLLPDGYYAEAHTGGEFRVESCDEDGGGEDGPPGGPRGRRFYGDVLGLHEGTETEPTGVVALAERPPVTRFAEQMPPVRSPRSVVVRHGSGGRLVGLIEVVSPGNRDGRGKVAMFCDRVEAALRGEVHVLLIDLFPPTPLVPAGMHGAVAARFGLTYDPPPGEPLTCAAYRSAGGGDDELRGAAGGGGGGLDDAAVPHAGPVCESAAGRQLRGRLPADPAGVPGRAGRSGRHGGLTPPRSPGRLSRMSDPAAVPLHDWTRVRPGAYHDFHTAWLVYLRRDLKALLPPNYYADIQTVMRFDPPESDEPEWREADVLGLHREPAGRTGGGAVPAGGVALAEAPSLTDLGNEPPPDRRRRIRIRNASGDRGRRLGRIRLARKPGFDREGRPVRETRGEHAAGRRSRPADRPFPAGSIGPRRACTGPSRSGSGPR